MAFMSLHELDACISRCPHPPRLPAAPAAAPGQARPRQAWGSRAHRTRAALGLHAWDGEGAGALGLGGCTPLFGFKQTLGQDAEQEESLSLQGGWAASRGPSSVQPPPHTHSRRSHLSPHTQTPSARLLTAALGVGTSYSQFTRRKLRLGWRQLWPGVGDSGRSDRGCQGPGVWKFWGLHCQEVGEEQRYH